MAPPGIVWQPPVITAPEEHVALIVLTPDEDVALPTDVVSAIVAAGPVGPVAPPGPVMPKGPVDPVGPWMP